MKNPVSPSPAKTLKTIVIGGSGLIGTKLCNNLRALGHDVLAASPPCTDGGLWLDP